MTADEFLNIFSEVLEHDTGALKWGNPEPWIHAELFAEFNRQSNKTHLIPFDSEVPYATRFPVLPRKENHKHWKYVDLCLLSDTGNDWFWFEFKVRPVGTPNRNIVASKGARDQFRKDVIALLGFEAHGTAELWENEINVKSYWTDKYLIPLKDTVNRGRHHFYSIFLQIGGELNKQIWDIDELEKEFSNWCITRGGNGKETQCINLYSVNLDGYCLVMAYW